MTSGSIRLAMPLMAALVMSGCTGDAPADGGAAAATDPAGSAPLTASGLGSAEYAGVLDRPVRLADGVWEGEPYVAGGAARPRVELVDRLLVEADLDGDGLLDAVTLLARSTGGSGVWTYLAVALDGGGFVARTAVAELGQRVQVRGVEAREGVVEVDLVAHGPEEPMCCPTRMVRATFALEGGDLVEVSREDLGAVAVADLDGTSWRLVELGLGQRVAEGIEVTMVVEGDRIAGSAGCNRYSATVASDAPTALAVGPVAATRMACQGAAAEVESRYLPALEAVTGFSFMAGDLVLQSAGHDGAPLALVFDRVPG